MSPREGLMDIVREIRDELRALGEILRWLRDEHGRSSRCLDEILDRTRSLEKQRRVGATRKRKT